MRGIANVNFPRRFEKILNELTSPPSKSIYAYRWLWGKIVKRFSKILEKLHRKCLIGRWMCYLFHSSAIMLSCFSPAFATEAPNEIQPSDAECSIEELMAFFPEPVVQDVLIRAKVPPKQARAIAQELASKNHELATLVDAKASKMDPNPFEERSQRELGLKIYRETLYEVFSKALKDHGISDETKAQELLEGVRESKSKLFIECIRRQQAPH